VNAICPGYFKTEINDTFLESEVGQKMLKRTPARREGKLSELDAPLLMLAGDGSTFVTGVALPVDGAHSVHLL
jgi:NAD(P)-dependent dehydrogenase (short-subunit alcohol dehydrogenase family)